MSKLPADVLNRLHKLLATEFVSILEDGAVILDEETGKATRVTPAAPLLSVIRQFLKDNGVVSVDPTKDDDLRRATTALPSFDDDDISDMTAN
ncbi:MAG: hypothetical protein Q7V31_12025 [Parvibaculum sp.]|uniref:hypothetical protein n=1 Tax=Parvibaculum sp. TaxID=2024848 RepID=UPI00272170F4|nr:hypothetical protein [Parvibaculum sp.]MDO8839644.1 hypothetical protein [Parvibaculum sp.]